MNKSVFVAIVIVLFSMLLGEIPQIGKEGNNLFVSGNFVIEKNITHSLNRMEYSELKIENAAYLGKTGEAELPAFSKLVSLPETGNYILSDFSYDYETINLEKKIIPVGWEDKLPVNAEYYTKNEWFPKNIVTVSKPNIMRGIRFAQITIAAVQYNPQKNLLRVLKNIKADFRLDESKNENPLTRRQQTVSETFQNMAQGNIFGFQRSRSVTGKGSYLFIIPNDYLIENNIEDLARWKEKLGYETHIATTSETGFSNTSIKNYIQNAYDTWEIPPEYVVLVGDVSGQYQIPTFYVDGYLYPYDVSDHSYSLLEGDDYFPDVMVGRFSIQSVIQLQTIIDKIENYEGNPYQGNWMKKALMTCYFDSDFSTPRETKMAVKEKLLDFNYTAVDTFFSPYQYNQTQLINMINQGYSFINYRGYGSHDYWVGAYGHLFDVYNIQSLTNGYRLPMITSIVCGGGDFGASEEPSCFGETWLNSGYPGAPKGAIGFIGPSERDTKTQFNNANDIGIYQGITNENLFRCGEMLLRGKMELYKDYPTCHGWGNSLNSDQFYFFVYNLLGDPGVTVWTDIPKNVALNFNETINSSQNFLAVRIDIQESEKNGFTIAVTNDDSLFACGFTDEFGEANIPLSLSAGTYEITASKQGYIPKTENLTVTGNGELTLINYQFSPAAIAGESSSLQITLKNIGNDDLENIGVSLSSEDALISVLSSTVNINSIPAGTTENCTFEVKIEKVWNSTQERELLVHTNSAYGEQEFLLPVEIQAPELSFVGLNAPGNNNYLIQNSNEEINIVLQNRGNIFSAEVTAVLNSLNDNTEVIQPNAVYTNVTAGSSAESEQPFIVRALEVPSGSPARFRLDLFSEGIPVQQIFIDYPIGIIDTNAPTFCDYGYAAIESSDEGFVTTPQYNWIELRPYNGGNGTQISANYSTNDGFLDIVDLPNDFHFQYFGNTFDKITIASNGYINLGESNIIYHRNRTIPSGVGPNNMIAPFWDDLSGGNIYYYYDAANHYFVVEWYGIHCSNYTYYQSTFEVILYDSHYYPTATGDGEILFQYNEIHNVDQYDNYATVGIENETQDEGVLLTYSHIAAPTAHQLSDNSAILFKVLAQPQTPFLTVSPAVINLALLENKTQSAILLLANNGNEDSEVGFSISVSETRDNGKKDNERPVDWISLPIPQGSVSGENFREIPIVISSEDLAVGNYNSVLEITSDNGDYIEVPVNLTVNPTSVDDENVNGEFILHQNFPNPFRNSTTISFEFSNEQNRQNEQSIISIYNIKGQKIRTLESINRVDAKATESLSQIIWDGKDNFGKKVNSGIYFYKLSSGKFNSIKKMILMK